MITAGVDLASQPRNTGFCVLRWEAGAVQVEHLEGHLDDDGLRRLVQSSAEKVGVDVPLGWPRRFVELVHRHSEMRSVEPVAVKRLTHRATDHWVHARCGIWPLSVSTDRIAYPALRAAPLLTGKPRDGSGQVVEVYPAAALIAWGLANRRYKGAEGRGHRGGIVGQLLHALPGLGGGTFDPEPLLADDNRLDALVAALVARAVACGLCEPIPARHLGDARAEGWIHLPSEGSLVRLGAGAA